MKPERKNLKLVDIIRDPYNQVRVKDHQALIVADERVDDMTKALQRGEQFTRVRVGLVDGKYYLMDGWHRYAATARQGVKERVDEKQISIRANVYTFETIRDMRSWVLKNANAGQLTQPLREVDRYQIAWQAFRLNTNDGQTKVTPSKAGFAREWKVSNSLIDKFKRALASGCDHPTWSIAQKDMTSRAQQPKQSSEASLTAGQQWHERVDKLLKGTGYSKLPAYKQRQAVQYAKMLKSFVDSTTRRGTMMEADTLVASFEYLLRVMLKGAHVVKHTAFDFDGDSVDDYLSSGYVNDDF